MARRVAADGALRGVEFALAASAVGSYSALVYGARRQEFMVVWEARRSERRVIYGARLPRGSAAMPRPFAVSSTHARSSYDDLNPDVAYDRRTGGYLVGWHRVEKNQSPGVRHAAPVVRLLPASPGGRPGPSRQLTRRRLDGGSHVYLTYSAREREFVATWSAGPSRARRVGPDGVPYGSEPAVTRGTLLTEAYPDDVAADGAGYIVLIRGYDNTHETKGERFYARRMGPDLGLRRLRPVSRQDALMSVGSGALAFSPIQGLTRAVWTEGPLPPPNSIEPTPPWEVFTRGL